MESVEAYLAESYDAVGLLLLIRLTRDHQLIMSRRRVPVLDATFDRVNLSLWPRFKKVKHTRTHQTQRPSHLQLSPFVCIFRTNMVLCSSVQQLSCCCCVLPHTRQCTARPWSMVACAWIPLGILQATFPHTLSHNLQLRSISHFFIYTCRNS